MVIGRTEGVRKEKVKGFRVNGEEATQAKKGDVISLPWATRVLKDDKLYKVIQGTDA